MLWLHSPVSPATSPRPDWRIMPTYRGQNGLLHTSLDGIGPSKRDYQNVAQIEHGGKSHISRRGLCRS
jgi:hypothetical protein